MDQFPVEQRLEYGEYTSPPELFNLSTYVDDEEFTTDFESQFSFNVELCQLCHSARRYFYCTSCVQDGLFLHSSEVHSAPPSGNLESEDGSYMNRRKISETEDADGIFELKIRENFSEKALRFKELAAEQSNLSALIANKISISHNVRRLHSEIQSTRDNIAAMKRMIAENNSETKTATKNLEVRSKERHEYERSVRMIQRKLEKIKDYLNSCNPKVDIGRKEVEAKNEKLSELRRKRIHELVSDIFVIKEIRPEGLEKCNYVVDEDGSPNSDNPIDDACQTTYVNGRWVYRDMSLDSTAYAIVVPLLPATGDYSSFKFDQIDTREAVCLLESGKISRNPSSTILAGLSLTSQLVSMLEYYLDTPTPLPHRYVEFSGEYRTRTNSPTEAELPLREGEGEQQECKEMEFYNEVYKLNRNVLYLCFTQNVNLNCLNPRQTIYNLQLLLHVPSLGSNRVARGDHGQMTSMEESLLSTNIVLVDLSFAEDDPKKNSSGGVDDPDNALIEKGWENVPASLPEHEMCAARPISPNYFTSGLSSTLTSVAESGMEGVNTAGSIAGSMLSSVVSMLPWKWGGGGGKSDK